MSSSHELADIAESDNTLSAYRPIQVDSLYPVQTTSPSQTGSFFQYRPSSHHRLSVFTCLCCCCPVGLSSFIYSYKARRAKEAGDFKLAERHSKTAKELAIASIVLFIFLLVVAGLIGGIIYYTFLHQPH
ncbi:hypothetical protein SNE40_002180 [Patella caerulea]|uniref:Uncharacterized protein n=1 Tax=Patella caerulea TaxID=87958 RepID=A0AAN8K6Q7_PATCE